MKSSLWVPSLILLLCACGCFAQTHRSSEIPEVVTLKLEEYKELFQKAVLAEDRRRSEVQREELATEYRLKVNALEKERESLKKAAEKRSSARDRVLPGNWLLLNHSAAGAYHLTRHDDSEQQGMAVFDFAIDFHMFDNVWTEIRLIDSQIIVGDWEIFRKVPAGGNSTAHDDFEWSSVLLGPEMLLVLKPRSADARGPGSGVGGESPKDSAGDEGTLADHVLMTNQSGTYRVHFRAHSHVQNTRSLHSLSLNLAYPLSLASLRLHHGGGGSVAKEFSIEPAAFHEVAEAKNYTEISMRLPSTKVVKLKWRVVAAEKVPRPGKSQANRTQATDEDVEETKDQSSQATVQHDALFSVAEGVLQSSNAFKFTFDSEQSLSTLEVLVHGDSRVTSVVAHGMQTWSAKPLTNLTLEDSAEGQSGNGTLVQVVFKSSVMSKEAIVLLKTESHFDVEGGRVELPFMVCRNVLRQTGSMAVVKAANAEVYEHTSRGVARAGVGEIPASVRSQTNRPIVLAYKYLAPRHSVILSALHHEEVHTLNSVADVALYQVLVVDTQRMHKLMMVVQNSQQQYMVVRDIPAAATVWSLRVNSLSTKPARGRDGTLMVPLLVGTGGDSNEGGAAPQASIELAWMSEHPSLGDNGSLVLSPPRVDMPITALSVEVQLPEQYTFNFTGTLQNVSIFSRKQPRSVNYQTERHVIEKGFKFDAEYISEPSASEEKANVKATLPKQGTRYRFEKILVVGDNAVLTATYALNLTSTQGGHWSWRSLFGSF